MSRTNIQVYRGGDIEIPFVLVQDGRQQPLNTPDEITVLLPGESGTIVKKLTVSSGVVITSDERGEFKAVLDESETANLVVGENQDIVVKIDRGSEDIVRVLKAILNVEDPPLTDPNP